MINNNLKYNRHCEGVPIAIGTTKAIPLDLLLNWGLPRHPDVNIRISRNDGTEL